MFSRRLIFSIHKRLKHFPAVVLLGARQVGKTTLALDVARERPSIYLDLESSADLAKLADAEAYLEGHDDKLVILDEIQRLPGLFQNLRGIIDRGRQAGRGNGRFLLLGSASLDLLKQSGESLAGRVSLLELTPLNLLEVGKDALEKLWVRGGFPESLLAGDDEISFQWRHDFIHTYLERDIPQLGPRIPAETMRRFWTMLAHNQSTLLNAAELARALGVDGKTVASYLDLLIDLLLVRRLSPWRANIGKRLVKSPRVLIRDSGLTHALLGLRKREELLGHPVAGRSWEAFVIETLLGVAPSECEPSFFRTSAGAEIDLLLPLPNHELWAIEIKRSRAPRIDRGFHNACADVQPTRRVVVYPGSERYPVGDDIEVISLGELAQELCELR